MVIIQDADSDAHDHMRSSADAELVAMRVELGAAAGENEDVVSFIRAVTCTLCYSLFNSHRYKRFRFHFDTIMTELCTNFTSKL
jgi:hypothetical protein